MSRKFNSDLLMEIDKQIQEISEVKTKFEGKISEFKTTLDQLQDKQNKLIAKWKYIASEIIRQQRESK